jgi:hypothetical protein
MTFDYRPGEADDQQATKDADAYGVVAYFKAKASA